MIKELVAFKSVNKIYMLVSTMFLSNKNTTFLENEPVDSVLVQGKKAFPNDSGLVLRAGMFLSNMHIDIGTFKLTWLDTFVKIFLQWQVLHQMFWEYGFLLLLLNTFQSNG